MNENISAFMDGELEGAAADSAVRALKDDPQALETWRTYHLISDAMRDTPLLSGGFVARLGERLAAEPTVLAPQRRSEARWTRVPAAIAAGVAGVALVGWLAVGQQSGQAPGRPVASAPSAAPAGAPEAAQVLVPLPSATPDYLLAHQGFSPRMSFQGMAPYVRTVSEPIEARR